MSTNGMIIFSKNIPRVSSFYQAVLNMSVVEKTNSHEVLENGSIELVVHGIPKKVASNIVLQEPPSLRGASAIKPAFVVDSLDRIKQACKDNGGGVSADNKIWEIRGTRVLDGWDPEGNVIQFKELKS